MAGIKAIKIGLSINSPEHKNNDNQTDIHSGHANILTMKLWYLILRNVG